MNQSAVFVLNKRISQDPIIKSIWHPAVVNIFPGLAEEPLGGEKSYPYIRYLSVPVISARNMWVRRDVVQYFVGSKDIDLLQKVLERLIYILDSPDQVLSSWPANDVANQFKIQSTVVLGGTPQTLPSQDEGVWEQGISVSMIYTITRHDFSTDVDHGVDSELT